MTKKVVDKEVPLYNWKRGGKNIKVLSTMEVGDSFEVHSPNSHPSRLWTPTANKLGIKVVVRAVPEKEGYFRVWRTE